jgi:hypothetical protein
MQAPSFNDSNITSLSIMHYKQRTHIAIVSNYVWIQIRLEGYQGDISILTISDKYFDKIFTHYTSSHNLQSQ